MLWPAQVAGLFILLYNSAMYLSPDERKEVMALYGYDKAIDKGYYQVEPDTWIYLFECDGKKYLLISGDYLGAYEFDTFPHLLKFENNEFGEFEFSLQREIAASSDFSKYQNLNVILFEYFD